MPFWKKRIECIGAYICSVLLNRAWLYVVLSKAYNMDTDKLFPVDPNYRKT